MFQTKFYKTKCIFILFNLLFKFIPSKPSNELNSWLEYALKQNIIIWETSVEKIMSWFAYREYHVDYFSVKWNGWMIFMLS